uniref:7TM_GPCR_Srx domain-containing protein n=1 Tax=Steinernema glaseri TaxID=37863 RepID=A0A1I7Z983_9BILA
MFSESKYTLGAVFAYVSSSVLDFSAASVLFFCNSYITRRREKKSRWRDAVIGLSLVKKVLSGCQRLAYIVIG